MSESPEQKARHDIEAKLIASGWFVQDRDDLDLTAGRGIAAALWRDRGIGVSKANIFLRGMVCDLAAASYFSVPFVVVALLLPQRWRDHRF